MTRASLPTSAVHVRAVTTAPLYPTVYMIDTSALRARLDAFLPAMRAANDELSRVIADRGDAAVDIEAVDESKPYILMVSLRTR